MINSRHSGEGCVFIVMAVLDTAIFFHAVDARISPRMTALSIVIPAKAGIHLSTFRRSKLDPDFRQGDEENKGRGNISS